MNNDASELFGRGYQILQDRNVWEKRQRLWYLMRNDGVPRARREKWQADMHLKLIDEKVNQKKAFTLSRIFGAPTLGNFQSLRQQTQELTKSAEQFFDFEMKRRTNFVRTMMTMEDTKQLRGRGIIKAYVDPFDDYRIVHEAIDPLYLLMPDDVDGFEDAYEWVHVRQIPVALFKLDRRWCPDDRDDSGIDAKAMSKLTCKDPKEVTERLKTNLGQDFSEVELDREYVQGYMHSTTGDTVVVWEHIIKTMGGYTVYSYCPSAMDVCVRRPYGIPYKINGKVSSGFFSFQREIKDEGWYSPRGIAEVIRDLQNSGDKMWNAKIDAMSLWLKPTFTAEVGSQVQNGANYRLAEGEVLPPGIKPTPIGQMPIAFDQEIAFVRGEAELAAQSPDMGIEKPGQRGNDKRTAKEVGIASNIASVGLNLESMVLADDLSKLYAHDWGLMLQFKRKQLQFFVSDDLKVMPEDALHGEYLITAGGATDEFDKSQRMQRASQRYQLLLGKPNINQDELVSEMLETDDARLVKKLVIPQQQKQASEAADENTEINDMCPGPNRPSFPVQVQPGQDHFVRSQTILAWLDAATKMNTPVSPQEKQRLFQHLGQHVQFLKKLQPKQYKIIEQMIHQMEAQSRQQPQGGVPMRQRPIGPAVPPMRPAGSQQPMRMI